MKQVSPQIAEINGYECHFADRVLECPRARALICKYRNRRACKAYQHEHHIWKMN